MRISTLLAGLVGAVVLSPGAPVPASPAQVRLVDNTVQALSPFDVANPAVGLLDPALLGAVQRASTAAAADGVAMTITSGWRSAQFQQQLLDDAVATYGSLAAARQYVQTPEGSRHVLGQAVDIGGPAADQWLMANGARYGLCRTYANEPWHFELTADPAGLCPPMLASAAG
ncbi:MAG: M15 family metallopeptidase [Mycobacterium sp.]|nr:M15 family metallopeptidase [Mycobacterium sp.]